jgi:hypothetical protein
MPRRDFLPETSLSPPISITFEIGDKTLSGVDCHRFNCVVGDPVKPTTALVGDSHASMFARGFDKTLKGSGTAIEVMATGDMLADYYPDFYYAAPKYSPLLAEVKAKLAEPEIRTIILSARYTIRVENTPFNNGEGGIEILGASYNGRTQEQKIEVLNSIGTGTRALIATGKHVILVYPVPEAGWHVPSTLEKLSRQPTEAVSTSYEAYRRRNDAVSTSYETYSERNAAVIALFDSLPDAENLIRIRPDRIFCDTFVPGRCATHARSKVFYYDESHLSTDGAALVITDILEAAAKRWGGF